MWSLYTCAKFYIVIIFKTIFNRAQLSNDIFPYNICPFLTNILGQKLFMDLTFWDPKFFCIQSLAFRQNKGPPQNQLYGRCFSGFRNDLVFIFGFQAKIFMISAFDQSSHLAEITWFCYILLSNVGGGIPPTKPDMGLFSVLMSVGPQSWWFHIHKISRSHWVIKPRKTKQKESYQFGLKAV